MKCLRLDDRAGNIFFPYCPSPSNKFINLISSMKFSWVNAYFGRAQNRPSHLKNKTLDKAATINADYIFFPYRPAPKGPT